MFCLLILKSKQDVKLVLKNSYSQKEYFIKNLLIEYLHYF